MTTPTTGAAEKTSSPSWEGETPEIAVLIPTHERRASLGALIDALERARYDRRRFEVVIVDDASTDDTWSALRERVRITPLRLLAARAGVNAGPAAARNLAASLARADLFAFTDDDCLPASGWLASLREGLRDAEVVQGRTLPDPAQARSGGAWSRSVWITAPTRLYETCNIGWRRDAFERQGGFPTARPDQPGGTRAHFGEDVELGWRHVSSGGSVAYRAGALVHHAVHPGSFGGWLAERRRLGLFPGLVRRTPGMSDALRLGVFLSWDTAIFDLALGGAAAAVSLRRPWVAALTLPWLYARWRDARHIPGRTRAVRAAQLAVGDAVGLTSLLAGSIKGRRLVL